MSTVIYQIGSVQFVIVGMNAMALDRDEAARFAEKPVLGKRPPLEYIGHGTGRIKLTARLFPQVLGGLDALSSLFEQQTSGSAFPVMRSDGAAMGWYVINHLAEKHTKIDSGGVGKMIEVDIELTKSSKSSAIAGVISQAMGLFR